MRAVLSLFALVMAMAGVDGAPSQAQEEIRPAGRRIVGGERTDIKQHPWQVALDIRSNGQTFLCGGSIVADRWVLTAAHCLRRWTKPRHVRAKTGATNYMTSGSWLEVDQITIHDGYDPVTHENDIALVRLLSRPQGRVIPLATASEKLIPGQPLEVTGWGATAEGGETSRVLMKVSVPYVDNTVCNGPAAYNGAIKAGMMCAGYRKGGVDSCQGDSGGPIVSRSTDGAVLVGVVSWGEGCARKLRYGVYTRVASYAGWIAKIVARNAN